MSSAMNHRKRSRYSEQRKGAAFRAQSRQAFYRDGVNRANKGVFDRLKALFHRKTPKQPEHKGDPGAEE